MYSLQGKKYVGKCEWSMNRRVNTHRNNVRRIAGPPCEKHFQQQDHDFNKHAKFTIIEALEKIPQNKTELTKLLENKEGKWRKMLKTVTWNSFNIGYNYPQDITGCIK